MFKKFSKIFQRRLARTDIRLVSEYFKFYLSCLNITLFGICTTYCLVKLDNFNILVVRACAAIEVRDECGADSRTGIEICYCSGDLCNSAGGIVGSTSFTVIALIFTKFL